MAKIGRNEKCPCRSGKKFKHCCALNDKLPVQQQLANVTLLQEVIAIQADAQIKKSAFRELGVFFLYSTSLGDAWLLEMTGGDCVQIARDGVALEPPIDENSEVIQIDYSHTFALKNKQLILVAYADKSVETLAGAPTRELSAAIRRIMKRFSSDQLEKVHLPNPENTVPT
jgi:hypothetical protein